jgi:L-alanine-DL-glutamate epimerase-like enolase superfamily enzyme
VLRGAKMKIKEIRTHVLEAELSQPFSWSFGSTGTRSALLIEIEGADGTVGWGESYGPARPGIVRIPDRPGLEVEIDRAGPARFRVN